MSFEKQLKDIFDIDMPRPDVPKPFSSKTALWKLIK